MKAVQYDTKSESGFRFIEDRPVPEASAGQVVIQVKAAAINPIDYKLPGFLTNKKIVGKDVAGIIHQVGEGVVDFQIGDRVFGNAKGTLCEFALCSAVEIAKIPEGLSFTQAAAMPTTYLSGYQALKDHGFKSGHKLLVIGASGGTGTAGIQLGKAMNAGEIIGVCSLKNEVLVKELGADGIVDYHTEDIVTKCGEKHFDFVYDVATGSGAGENYRDQSRKVLKDVETGEENKGVGMYVALNGPLWFWFRKFIKCEPKNTHQIICKHKKEDLEGIVDLMTRSEKGFAFLPIIDTELSFSEENVDKGFDRLKSRRAKGKVVFTM